MYANTFYPLRKIVSNLVPTKQIKEKPPLGAKLIYQSETAKALNYQTLPLHMNSLDQLSVQPFYNDFLPKYDDLIIPGNGMAQLPILNIFPPFNNSNSFISIYGKTDSVADLSISRKLSVKYLIAIDNEAFFKVHGRKPLIGGICFKGFPYSHFGINANGENNSNFGLPREVRITCINILDRNYEERFTDFLDEENTSVDQQITSHSGFHYVCCDPTFATHIILELSDFPFFTSNFLINQNDSEDFFGILIPYLYVFEYEEKTRYDKNVPSGFLGAKKNDDKPFHENVEWSLLNVTPGGSLEYFDFTAASIFGQQRTYNLISSGNEQELDFTNLSTLLQNPPKPQIKKGKPKRYQECFISKSLKKDEKVVLFFEQGEEFERCISGIRLLMPFVPKEDLQKDIDRLKQLTELFFPENLEQFLTNIPNQPAELLERVLELLFRVPEAVTFCSKTRIRIFELDPIDGVSPVNTKLDDKYSTLLADVTIDTLSEFLLANTFEGIKFKKASTSKYFAIEFTNLSEDSGQIVVKSLKYIQSAHVSISSRAAKTQRIKNLQFRIIGKGIADDYSRLGEEGFSFSIERQTAGKRGDVIFKANSLMDLLHNGVGKIFSNSRRRAVEFEKAEYNDAVNQAQGENNPNFSLQEGWRKSETGKNVNSNNDWVNKPQSAFRNYNNQTTRTKNEFIYPDSWKFNKMRDWFNKVAAKNGNSTMWIPDKEEIPSLWLDTDIWRGVSKNSLKIRGLKLASANPLAFTKLSLIDANIGEESFNTIFNTGLLKFTGGSSSSIGLSVGASFVVGGSLSTNIGINPYPTIVFQSTFGDQGLIVLQAVETGYSFSQFKNQDYNQFTSGEMKRKITHAEVPETEKQRMKGAEVMWQDELVDIITGTIPLNFDLPATASKMYFRTSDDTLRVRLGNGVGKSVSVDFWFDINEEIIKDDY